MIVLMIVQIIGPHYIELEYWKGYSVSSIEMSGFEFLAL